MTTKGPDGQSQERTVNEETKDTRAGEPVVSDQQATAALTEADREVPGRVQGTPRIWALHCPFRRSGSPVLGSFGYDIKPVVILPMATWTRLCREIPALGAMQFEVGSED